MKDSIPNNYKEWRALILQRLDRLEEGVNEIRLDLAVIKERHKWLVFLYGVIGGGLTLAAKMLVSWILRR